MAFVGAEADEAVVYKIIVDSPVLAQFSEIFGKASSAAIALTRQSVMAYPVERIIVGVFSVFAEISLRPTRPQYRRLSIWLRSNDNNIAVYLHEAMRVGFEALLGTHVDKFGNVVSRTSNIKKQIYHSLIVMGVEVAGSAIACSLVLVEKGRRRIGCGGLDSHVRQESLVDYGDSILICLTCSKEDSVEAGTSQLCSIIKIFSTHIKWKGRLVIANTPHKKAFRLLT
jgi:hypothetical protein